MAEEIKLSSKEARALAYMQDHGSISNKEALEQIGDGRLSNTIMGLRRKGYDIDCLRIDIQNRYGEPTWYGKYVFSQNK